MTLADALPELHDEGGTIAPHPLEGRWNVPPVVWRALGGVGTGVVCGVAVGGLSPEPMVAPVALGLAAGIAAAFLPRVGWLAAVLATLVAVGASAEPRTGSAVLLFFAALPIPFLLRSRPTAWSLPALAPALGLLGLAGAFPAVAGRARTAPRRAALGALGAWAVLLAEPLLDRALLVGAPDAVRPLAWFDGGATLALTDVLAPICGAAGMVFVAVWALAAAILPWIVTGRRLSLDVAGAAAWAVALAAATAAIATAAGPGAAHPSVLGPLLGGALALALQWPMGPPRAGY